VLLLTCHLNLIPTPVSPTLAAEYYFVDYPDVYFVNDRLAFAMPLCEKRYVDCENSPCQQWRRLVWYSIHGCWKTSPWVSVWARASF